MFHTYLMRLEDVEDEHEKYKQLKSDSHLMFMECVAKWKMRGIHVLNYLPCRIGSLGKFEMVDKKLCNPFEVMRWRDVNQHSISLKDSIEKFDAVSLKKLGSDLSKLNKIQSDKSFT